MVSVYCGLIEIVLWLYCNELDIVKRFDCGLIEIVLWLYLKSPKHLSHKHCGLIEIVLWLYFSFENTVQLSNCGLIEIVLWLYSSGEIVLRLSIVVWLKSFFDYIGSRGGGEVKELWFDWNRSLTIFTQKRTFQLIYCGLIEIVLWLY